MMCEKDPGTTTAAGGLDKKSKAREPGRGLNRHFRLFGQSADISRPNLAAELEVSRDLLDKARVPPRFSAAQLMIQMADNQFVVAQVDQEMQQCDGIATAGNADKIALGAREVAKELWGLDQSNGLLRLHRETSNPPTPEASAWQTLICRAIAQRRRNAQRPTSNAEA